MSPSPLIALLLLLVLSVSGFPDSQAAPVQQPAGLEQTIHFLIDHVATSGRTFIRNSNKYDAPEAARHMQKKYEHFKNRIKRADDFIELAASKSLMSGKPYLVVSEDGKTVHTSEWLRGVLAEYCKQATVDCAN